NGGAELDLLNQSETLGPGTFAGGRIETGSGLLTLAADVTVLPAGLTSFIIGRLSLGGAPVGGTPTRPLPLAGGAPPADLLINSAITSTGGTVNLVKRGPGTLELAGGPTGVAANYTGTTTALEGALLLDRLDGLLSVPHDLVVGDATGAS